MSKWAKYRLLRKLKVLRSHLKVWNKEVLGNIDFLQKIAKVELHEWDLKAELRPLTNMELRSRRDVRSLVWKLSRNKDRLWHQKSRMLWTRNGDKNTRFFHIMASRRQRNNMLDIVIVEGVSLEVPVQIKQNVVRHFRQ